MKQSTIQKINEHLKKARNKHPKFAPGGPLQVVSLSAEELGEMAQAVNDWYTKPDMLCDWGCSICNEYMQAKDEALDLIAVLVRFIEGD